MTSYEQLRTPRGKHGMFGTRPYRIYTKMKARCYNPREASFKNYGAKGITVSDAWKNSFEAFWNDVQSGYFEGAQIDRIDNTKGYSKENCRWVTGAEQARNRKGVTLHSFGGEMLSLHDIAGRTGIPRHRLYYRIQNGESIAHATRDGASDSYMHLVLRISELLPGRKTREPIRIEDVLRAIEAKGFEHITLDHYGNMNHLGRYPSQVHTWGTFINLTKPLSAPENEVACAAVLKLLSV